MSLERLLAGVLPAVAGAAVITGMLALAAGPIAGGIAPLRAVAAASTGPSEAGCARAFDGPANRDLRATVARSQVLRVQVLATAAPACVIRFQLANQRVLTLQAPWANDTASGFQSSVHRRGLVAGANALWRHGLLTTTGLRSDVPLLLGPEPTDASCLDAWNAAPPALPRAIVGAKPAVVQALNGGITIGGAGNTSRSQIHGYACTVWIAAPAGHATLVAGSWTAPDSSSWRRPIETDGLVAGAVPNADLGADGRLTLRTAAPIRISGPKRPAQPGISHVIAASGWAGGFALRGTLADAVRRFGTPTDRIRVGPGCEVTWPALQLTGTFAPCAGSGRATALTAASGWSTNTGLGVGAPESEITSRYPGAASSTSPATGVTTWFLAPRSGGHASLRLTAESRLGQVAAITVASGGGVTFGFDIVSPRKP